MRTAARCVPALLLAFLCGIARVEAQQSAEFRSLQEKVSEVQKQLQVRKNDEAGKAYVEAEKLLEAAQAKETTAAGKRAVSTVEKTLAGLKKNLESRGVKLAGGDAPKPAPTGTTPPAATGAGGTSFMKDVLPMLVSKCGNCHMAANNRGNFAMNTFDALMRGVGGTSVITAGKGKESRIYEIIESGDMPRGGGKVSPTELAALVKWIDEGAKFDGANRGMQLRNAGAQTPRERLQVVEATGNEKSKYSRDVASVFAANCIGCHAGQNAAGDLSLDSFNDLLRGGDNGLAIQPGKPKDSLLIKKLRGMADGQRMPLRKDPLSEDVIAKIELWISEGAKFDGPSPTMPTKTVAEIYEATQMTHEQLAERREQLAKANWNLGNPDVNFEKVESAHFLVVGNTVKSRLEEVAKTAEDQYAKVTKLLALTDDKPLLKGKLTLFVFNRHFEYTEYGTMVERRTLPKDWRGHWRFSIIDAYACIAPPKEEEDSLDRLLAELLVGAYIDSLGKVPTWFSQGAARAVSARNSPKSPAVLGWDNRVSGILADVGEPEKLLEGQIAIGDASVLSYAFCKVLLSRVSNYNALLKALKEGKPFDDAFKGAYGAEPAALIKTWAASARTGKRR